MGLRRERQRQARVGRAGTPPGRSGPAARRHALKIATLSATARDIQLALNGELDLGTVDVLHAAVADAIATGHERVIIVDLTELSFRDSTGVSALVNCYHEARTAGMPLCVTNAQDTVERVLRITGVWGLLRAH